MPELPEIEHLASSLRPHLVGKRVAGVRCRQPRMLNLAPEAFAERARGRIVAVERRGKSCVLRLEEGAIWLHLGLGGVVALDGKQPTQPQLAIDFDGGTTLSIDRTFMGHAHLYDENAHARRWSELGAEPTAAAFTPERLREILARKPRLAVKAVLMDQSLIAGIGNVYSDEALHVARLHPRRQAGSLSREEVARLHAAIRSVLAEATAAGGEPNYVDLRGQSGGYEMRVHGRAACLDCGTPTSRISLGGRTAYFCPRCQSQ